MQTDPTPTPADDLPAPPPAPAAATAAGPRRVDAPFMLTHPFHIVSLGFGSGLSRIAPGTAGTLFAWASFEVLNRYLTVLDWGLLIVAGYFAGIVVTGFTAKRLRADDPSLARNVGLVGADPVAVFAEVRGRKDHFK